ncbi:hypothetical protein UlMin_017442 [Ulmus minor]
MEMDSICNGNAITPNPTSVPNPNDPTPSSKLSQLVESLKLEHQFLRVTFKHYKKTIRANHRVVEKDISGLEEGSRVEHLQAQRCRAHLDHLESVDTSNLSDWNNIRLECILVDYMMHMSYYDIAAKLAESSNIQRLCVTKLRACRGKDRLQKSGCCNLQPLTLDELSLVEGMMSGKFSIPSTKEARALLKGAASSLQKEKKRKRQALPDKRVVDDPEGYK